MKGADYYIFWHGLTLLVAGTAMFLRIRLGGGNWRRFFLPAFLFMLGFAEWSLLLSSSASQGRLVHIAGYLLYGMAFVFLGEHLRNALSKGRVFLAVYPACFVLLAFLGMKGVDPLFAGSYLVAFPLLLLLSKIARNSKMFVGNSDRILKLSLILWHIYVFSWLIPSPDPVCQQVLFNIPYFNAAVLYASAVRAAILAGALFILLVKRYDLFFSTPGHSYRWGIPLVYTVILITTISTVAAAGMLAEKSMRSNVLCMARGIASGINPDRVNQLSFTIKDRENPVFIRMRKQMKLWSDFTGLRRIYCMYMRNGRLISGPDNIDENDPVASAPGSEYLKPDRGFSEAWIRGESGTAGPYADEYGSFVSGYAPVFDRMTGRVLMLVCIDYNAASWEGEVKKFRLSGFIPSMIFSIFMLLSLMAFNIRESMAQEKQGFLNRYLAAFCVFVAGFIIVCTVSWWMHYIEERGIIRDFRSFADSWSNIIRSVIVDTRNHSEELALYFNNSGYVSWDEFRGYYSGKNLFPVISVSWYPAVRSQERAEFEQRMRHEGLAGYRIYRRDESGNRDFIPAGDVLFPLAYAIPTEYGSGTRGMDISALPAVMDAAECGITGVMLKDGAESAGRMALVSPVFRGKILQGVIVSCVDMELSLRRVLAFRNSIPEGIRVLLADVMPGGDFGIVASYPGGIALNHGSQLLDVFPVYPLFYAGRTFAIKIWPSENFIHSRMNIAGQISFALGMIVTVIITLLAGYFSFRESTLEQKVDMRTGELRQSEERFRTLHEASFGGIAVHDHGVIISCNRGLSEMTGYSINELSGMDGIQLVAPAWRGFIRENIESGYEGASSAEVIKKDGSIFPVDITAKKIPLQGKMVRITELRDITARRNAELLLERQKHELEKNSEEMQSQIEEFEAVNEELLAANTLLAESEEKFYRAFNINPSLMIISTLDSGRIIDVNETFTSITGYTREQVIGMTSLELEFFIDHSQREIMADFVRISGAVSNYEVDIRVADGSVRHGLFSADRIRVKDSDYLLSVINDITDRKRFETALRDSEKKYRILFEFLLDAVFLLENNRFTDCNNTATEMFGCGREDIIGSTPALFSPEYQPGGERSDVLMESKIGPAAAGQKQHFHWVHRRKDGVEFYTDVSLGIFELEGKKHILSIVRDVTERKKYESKFNHMQKMDAIGQLAGGIAHDFNNQLAGIMGYADLLSMKLENPTLKKYADGIKSVAARSSEMTKKLLVLSKKQDLRHMWCDIHQIIRDTIEILEHSIDRRIGIKHVLDAPAFMVSGDPVELQNIMLNLGLNARDAMENGGTLSYETSVVKIGADDNMNHLMDVVPGDYILVAVSDTGCGISEEVKSHLFEPFFTTKVEGKGTGLGLASVYATVKNHGGSINVYSEKGKGAVFRIYLPLGSGGIDVQAQDGRESFSLPPQRILVVDDEIIIREILCEMLTIEGHDVLQAGDGKEAIGIYAENWSSINLVILDMVMPGMNGSDTFVAMQKINPYVRVILSTGFSLASGSASLMRLGVKGYVHKPFQKNELLRVIFDSLKQ